MSNSTVTKVKIPVNPLCVSTYKQSFWYIDIFIINFLSLSFFLFFLHLCSSLQNWNVQEGTSFWIVLV